MRILLVPSTYIIVVKLKWVKTCKSCNIPWHIINVCNHDGDDLLVNKEL